MPDTAAFVPEIVSDKISEAEAAVKIACLYFPQVNLHSPALSLRGLRVEKAESGFNVLEHPEHRARVSNFLARCEPLRDEGILRITKLDATGHDELVTVLSHWQNGLRNWLPEVRNHFNVPDGSDRAAWIDFELGHVLASQCALMQVTEGVPTATQLGVQRMFNHGMRKAWARLWEQVGQDERKRMSRDAVALEVLKAKLPSVADLEFEQICELRRLQGDGLLAFRAAIAKLTDGAEGPLGEGFAHHVAAILENDVEPALRDLERQLTELRGSSRLAYVGALPAVYSTALMSATVLGLVPIGAATAAVTAGVAANAAYAYVRARQARRQLLGSNAFSVLLDVPIKPPRPF